MGETKYYRNCTLCVHQDKDGYCTCKYSVYETKKVGDRHWCYWWERKREPIAKVISKRITEDGGLEVICQKI